MRRTGNFATHFISLGIGKYQNQNKSERGEKIRGKIKGKLGNQGKEDITLISGLSVFVVVELYILLVCSALRP